MANEGQSSVRSQPESDPAVYDFPSLSKALQAYCENTSAALILDPDPVQNEFEGFRPRKRRKLSNEEPPSGAGQHPVHTNAPIAAQNFSDGVGSDDVHAVMEEYTQYWQTVKGKIDAFVETPNGVVVKQSIIKDLKDQLSNGDLKQYHGDAPILEDMYELFIAHRLAFRQDLRAKTHRGHPVLPEPTFRVRLVMEVQNSTSIREKAIHVPIKDGAWTDRAYQDFCDELRIASQGPQAEQEGFKDGYGLKDGPWLYENFDAKDSETLEEFNTFDIDTWKQMRGNIPYLLWHSHQYALRKRDLDSIDPNSVQNADMHILQANLVTNPMTRNGWRDITAVGNTIAPTLMTSGTARDWWKHLRDNPFDLSWNSIPGTDLTAEELAAIVAECESPKGKDRANSMQIEALPQQKRNLPWHEWNWKDSELLLTEEMNAFDEEASRWEAHLSFLFEAGIHAKRQGGANAVPSTQPGGLSLADELMQYGSDGMGMGEDWKQFGIYMSGADETHVDMS